MTRTPAAAVRRIGRARLGCNDPKCLIHRHGARDCRPAEPVGKALAAMAADTVAKRSSPG